MRQYVLVISAGSCDGGPTSRHIYRKLRLADTDPRILLQRTQGGWRKSAAVGDTLLEPPVSLMITKTFGLTKTF